MSLMTHAARWLAPASCFCSVFGATASGQMIRPDSATATTAFSSGYVITNAINGSGLPANFTLQSEHANYVSGNHWTTATGRTVGESATFNFNTAQTLGGFYMWQHRSNNIANNPFYAVVRFDLVLRDGSGALLANLTNLTALPNIATAQTIPFPITTNVRSVQFIVRETQNGNSSPYTGLAEVAFAPCIAVQGGADASTSVCPGGSTTIAAGEFGSAPFTYQWQIENANAPGGWETLSDGPYPAARLTFTGTTQASLGVTASTIEGNSTIEAARFRCILANTCGSGTSGVQTLRVCIADQDDGSGSGACDGGTTIDDLLYYLAVFEAGELSADVDDGSSTGTTDGGVTIDDLLYYLFRFEGGC